MPPVVDRAQQLMVARIIIFALAMGVGSFAVIVLIIAPTVAKGSVVVSFDPVGVVALVVAAAAVPMSLLVSRIVQRQQAPQLGQVYATERASRFGAITLTQTIVGAALCEGPAFFQLVTALLTGSLVHWVLGVVLAVLLVTLYFPTASRWEAADQEIERLLNDAAQSAAMRR